MAAPARLKFYAPVSFVRPASLFQGACTKVTDPSIFDAESHEVSKVAKAKAVCAGCPFAAECLNWAMVAMEYGVVGGLTDTERNKARRGKFISLEARQNSATAVAMIKRSATSREIAERFGVEQRTVFRFKADYRRWLESFNPGPDFEMPMAA